MLQTLPVPDVYVHSKRKRRVQKIRKYARKKANYTVPKCNNQVVFNGRLK